MDALYQSIACRVLLLGLLPFLMGETGAVSPDTSIPIDERGSSSLPAETGLENARSYTSHYLVFGARDDAGRPRIVAIDFNRTAKADSFAYEYKLFTAKGSTWSMPVYETWTVSKTGESSWFPARGGLAPTLNDGILSRVTTDLPSTNLEVRLEAPKFSFPTGDTSASGTGHPQFTVRWNGASFRGTGVYEHIRSSGTSPSEEAAAERERRLESESTFGLYDWIVLYDEKGRLWQVSQGTLTEDFAYQKATEALPRETHDVLVRWTATAYDSFAGQHSPKRWLVDVPAWKMRVKLRKIGEHRGHGPPRSDGTRPIYVQATVEGRGTIRGEKRRFFGMVEHIRD